MEGNVVCSICDEVMRDPRQLPCNHTYCCVCLQKYCIDNNDSDTFVCVECGKPFPKADPNKPLVDWVDDFPTDFSVARKIDQMQWLHGAKAKEKCVTCLKNWKALTATKYCKSCQEHFCDDCGNQHWLLWASKAHRVMLIDDLENFKNDPLVRAELTAVFSAKIGGKNSSSRSGNRSPRSRSPVNGLLPPRNVSPGNISYSARRDFLSPNNELQTDGHSPPRSPPASPRPKVHSNKLDSDDCAITDVTFLLDGCVLVSDERNCKLKLFDQNYRLLSSIQASCWNILALNEYFIAGSCHKEKCVKYFSIYDSIIEEESSVDVEKACYGLCLVNEQLAVGCAGPTVSIKLLNNKNRSADETINLAKGTIPLRTPYYISYDYDNSNFIVSDSDSMCLKYFTKEGTLVWEKMFNDVKGLETYGSYILVARSKHNTVDILDSKGHCLKSIVSLHDDLLHTTALAIEKPELEDSGERLLVTDETDLVRVFSLLNPQKYIDVQSGDSQYYEDDSNVTKSFSKHSKLCVIL